MIDISCQLDGRRASRQAGKYVRQRGGGRQAGMCGREDGEIMGRKILYKDKIILF
jgi:hypothetical protein